MKTTIKFLSLILLTLVINCDLFAQHSVQVNRRGQTYTISGDTTKYNFKAVVAKFEERYGDAANLKIKAIEKGEVTKLDIGYYNAACYFSLAKDYENALYYLNKSIENGWNDLAHLEYDKDLHNLRKTTYWKKLEPKFNQYYSVNNREVAQLFSEDQKARKQGPINSEIAKKDSIRRVKVKELLKKRKISSAHDFYKAAFIMHHGTNVKDYKLAHKLARKANKRDDRHFRAPWLVAATKDRYLLKKGERQWYGTQGIKYVNGKPALDPKEIDITKATIKEREALNAPSIEKIKGYIKNYTDGKTTK